MIVYLFIKNSVEWFLRAFMYLCLFVYTVIITLSDNEYVKPVVKNFWKHYSSAGSIRF